MITITETPPYSRKADKLLSSSEKEELISYLSADPKSGVLITGSGGVRKLRWSRDASGKSRVLGLFIIITVMLCLYIYYLCLQRMKKTIFQKKKKPY